MNALIAPPVSGIIESSALVDSARKVVGIEAAAIAETYAHTAAAFAAIGDRRGVAYALRCAGAAILNATELAASLRTTNDSGV